MADEADTQAVDETASVETATEGSQPETQTQDSGDSSSEQSGESTASTGDNSASETQDNKQESKPVSRRSAQFRINQLLEENKTLKQQVAKPAAQEQDEWEQSAADDKPDIASLVAREVERRLNPIVSESTKTADDSEISELFSGDKAAERTKYEGKIREMWKLPQYKDVAATDLYKIASFNDAVQAATAKAIEEYKQAEKEAKESSASGTSNSNRTGKSSKSVNDLSDEEFAQRNERIKAGLPV